MLTGIHLLLTYKCTLECEHCFVYSSPNAEGTMTLSQIRNVLDESRKIDSVEWIYFEGGEPFLFYPSMLEAIKLARCLGFKVGIVTNAYGAISEEDAEAIVFATGMEDLKSLANADAEDLYKKIKAALAEGDVRVPAGYTFSIEQIQKWIEEAKSLV